MLRPSLLLFTSFSHSFHAFFHPHSSFPFAIQLIPFLSLLAHNLHCLLYFLRLIPCLYLLLLLLLFLFFFLPPLGPDALSAIIGQATPRTRGRTDTAIDPYNTDTDSTNSYNTRTVSDDINHNNRKTSSISHSSSNSNLSESDPRSSSLSTALALPPSLPGKPLSKDSTQPLYVPSMYIPIILPVPKSSTWCPIRVNVYAEDDVILRCVTLPCIAMTSLSLSKFLSFCISYSSFFIFLTLISYCVCVCMYVCMCVCVCVCVCVCAGTHLILEMTTR
jgi:hypothetical protein